MKKLVNVLALFVLVSVNVFTPISYAQSDEAVENLEQENVSPVAISQDEDEEEEFIVNEETQESEDNLWDDDNETVIEETVGDFPEVLDEMPSLINMVVDVVNVFTEENMETNEEPEESITLWNYEEELLQVADDSELNGTIVYEDWLIKVSDWEREIWLRDRNVGATVSTWLDKANHIYELSHELCVYQQAASVESEDEVSVQSERLYDVESCSNEFYVQASQVIWHSVNTVEDVNAFLDSYNPWEDTEYKKSFWNYYFWWNNVWLSYSELDIHDWDVNTDNESRYWSNYDDETWWEEWSSMVNPCDENNGEYLPTADEWYELIELWAGIKWHVFDEYWDLVGWGFQFRQDMLLPNAWGVFFYSRPRAGSLAADIELSSYDTEWYKFDYDNSQLLAALDNDDNLTLLYWYNNSDYLDHNDYGGTAAPVRCFVAVDPVTVTMDYWDWEIDTYKIKKWRTITKTQTSSREWYYIVWWYDNQNYEGERFDFSTPITEDITLYAKYGKFMHEDWIIKISDWDNEIWLRDRNVGAEISRWIELYDIWDLIDDECEITYDEEYSNRCQFSDDIDCYDYMTYQHYDCSSGVYKEISRIAWVNITAEEWLKEYINDYILSFWNYYFRWNNSGTNYAELVVDGNSSLITNMSELNPKFLEWWKLWNSEWDGWIEWKPQDNPCNGEWEYIPTPEDWIKLMTIWSNKNGYYLDDHMPNVGHPGEYSLGTFAMDSAWWLYFPGENETAQFLQDMLIPWAWMIFREQILCQEDDESNCDEMYYRNGQPALWMAQDKNWYVWAFYWMWIFYDTIENNIDMSSNDIAVPVRCFVDVPQVLVITLMSDNRVHEELNVVKWNTLDEPTAPSKSNYTFDGWYTEDGEKYIFSTPFTSDLTLYAKWTENKSSWGYSGWGGWSSSKPDKSNKETMDTKKDEPKVEETKKEPEQPSQWKTLDTTSPSKETFNAHQWAYSNGLTKYRTASEARMDDPLNRSEMAKISSIFATQFLDKVPNEKKKEFCSQYPDLWKVTSDMEAFIIESCELGYMWYESNGIDALERFRPYTPVTVAEAATILSRIVWWNENAMNGKDWYKWHLYASYNHGLIDDIKDPTKRSITRREAYLMLYRLITAHE